MNKKEWIEDLNYFVSKIEELHPNPYRNYDKEAFYEKLEIIKNQDSDLSKSSMIKVIAYLTSLLNDAHTCVMLSSFNKKVPISFSIMEDKLYIVNIKESNSDALYKEVLFINDIPTNDFLSKLDSYISYETTAYRDFKRCELLNNPYVLECYELINSDIYSISYDNNGQIEDINFNYKEDSYENLVIPISDKKYDYKVIEDYNTLYIRYTSCKEEDNYSMQEFANDIDNIINKGINKVIVDIRNNQGGDSLVIKPLIKVLEQFKDKELITLVNGGTFSSGMFSLVDLKNIGSIIMGSETGGPTGPRFGNNAKLVLPNSSVRFICSTKKFIIIEQDNKLIITTEGDFNTKPNFPMESFIPDIKIEPTIIDLINGKDTLLEEALNYKSRIK
jgi:hypothetical protein